jgi:hypothetical protein
MLLMPALPLIAAAVPTILLLLGWLYHLPVVIRRNDERIRNRDEDLRTWIEDDDAELRDGHLRILLGEQVKSAGPDVSLVQYQQLKNEVVHRYRDQLRDAERTVRDVALSEQIPHRLMRRLLRKPLPGLTAPTVKASTLDHWYQSPDDFYDISETMRQVGEQRRAEAGKPPLRPYQHPGRVKLV